MNTLTYVAIAMIIIPWLAGMTLDLSQSNWKKKIISITGDSIYYVIFLIIVAGSVILVNNVILYCLGY